MLHYLIMCKSLTYAQRAARVLEHNGITVVITKVPQSLAGEGCTYSVRVSEPRLTDALAALKRAGFESTRVFLQTAAGEVREVAR